VDAFQRAGFVRVTVQSVDVVWRFPSLEDALQNARDAQPALTKLLAELSPTDQAAAWDEVSQALQPFVGSDGFEGPGEYLVVAGAA
jgi:hypothetical protein